MVDALKSCFVVCPIGEEGSPPRIWSDDILINLIQPVAREFGYTARRAIDESRPGEITTRMIGDLIESDLVVCDLTFHNANVFYEMAVRHAQGKPFIHIAERDTKIPFDISNISTVFIDKSTFGTMATSREKLREHFKAVVEGTASFDNPIKRYQQQLQADQTDDPIIKRMTDLEEQVADLARRTDMRSGAWKRDPLTGRFGPANQLILRQQNERMRQALLGGKFKLISNPSTGASKSISFLPNGEIGEGRNSNEYSWRLRDGVLELIQADGLLHSSFVYVPSINSFQHAGVGESIAVQSIVPA